MNRKKILVSCGSAIATSTVVARKIVEELEKKDIRVDIKQCKVAEITSQLDGVDLIVTTTPVTGVGDIPVIYTLSFLTGIGVEADMEKIISYVAD